MCCAMFQDHQTTSRPSGLLRTAAALTCALLLSACGAGSAVEGAFNDIVGSGSNHKGTLEITTQSVPPGSPGVAYRSTQLEAAGADGPVTWTLAGGTLPPGMRLTSRGEVTGVPAAAGFYTFTAQASDGDAADEQPLAISVDEFGLQVVGGLHLDEAWSGLRVDLRTAGGTGTATFDVLENGSGGHFERVDGLAGTASWVPGPVGTSGAVDRIRVSDAQSGGTIELELPVAQNPAAEHIARFGSTDVWYLDTDGKHGTHPYASDFHAALAHLGLRGPTSTARTGTPADELAELVVRVQMLREINKLYLRNEDGTEGARGLAISFPLDRPGAGYSAPAAGSTRGSVRNGFNVMSLCDQQGHLGALGMAFQDAVGNPSQEHNAPSGAAGELGVFLNYVAESVDRTYRLYGDDLKLAPVNEADLPALKALLHGRAATGGRYDLLRYQVMALARSIAYIAAHEIGHSLGLPHLHTYEPGGIMNSVALIGPGTDTFFLAGSLEILRAGLPGPGRGTTGAQATAALRMPAGGIHVCGHCR